MPLQASSTGLLDRFAPWGFATYILSRFAPSGASGFALAFSVALRFVLAFSIASLPRAMDFAFCAPILLALLAHFLCLTLSKIFKKSVSQSTQNALKCIKIQTQFLHLWLSMRFARSAKPKRQSTTLPTPCHSMNPKVCPCQVSCPLDQNCGRLRDTARQTAGQPHKKTSYLNYKDLFYCLNQEKKLSTKKILVSTVIRVNKNLFSAFTLEFSNFVSTLLEICILIILDWVNVV